MHNNPVSLLNSAVRIIIISTWTFVKKYPNSIVRVLLLPGKQKNYIPFEWVHLYKNIKLWYINDIYTPIIGSGCP